MSARDRKLLTALAPLAVFALYWALLMNPALDQRAALEQPLADAQTERDSAVAKAAELEQAERRYETDYAELVKLSKAIPPTVAVSDLMRELNAAAKGTGIGFSNITMSEPAAAPVGGTTTTAALTPGAGGLDAIPVELTFDGRFFQLSDMFHRLQSFVRTTGGRLHVRGRLIRINEFSFQSAAFPNVTARIGATVYAAPAEEGPTDGATPVGPRGAERGDGGLKPLESFSSAATVVTP